MAGIRDNLARQDFEPLERSGPKTPAGFDDHAIAVTHDGIPGSMVTPSHVAETPRPGTSSRMRRMDGVAHTGYLIRARPGLNPGSCPAARARPAGRPRG